MSKRYGRNQKRKAREAIAALEQSNTRLEKDMQYEKTKYASYVDTIDLMYDVLGGDFFALQCKTYSLPKAMDTIQVASYPRMQAISSYEKISSVHHDLMRLSCVDCEVELDKLRKMLYVDVYVGGERSFAMNISHNEWRNVPRSYLIKKLSESFAAMFTDKLLHKGI